MNTPEKLLLEMEGGVGGGSGIYQDQISFNLLS